MKRFYSNYISPVGNLEIVVSPSHLLQLSYDSSADSSSIFCETPLIIEVKKQLDAYFYEGRREFTIPLYFKGTIFQKKVWNALLSIPYGTTCSYKDVAKVVGSEKAYRAVGNSNNRNPIVILCPCHRVIGANGKLVGYGGGLEKKIILMDLEKEYLQSNEYHSE